MERSRCPNPDCGEELPDHVRICVVCGTDAKPPNVRAASRLTEVQELQNRVIAAEEIAVKSGSTNVLNDFYEKISSSYAVICRSLSTVNELLSSDNQLFATFYHSVNSDSRLPENNEWDLIRQSVDGLLFPYYYQELRFAALSIDSSGVTGYGDYCLLLNDIAIRDRATVFEENSILFVKKHRIVAGDPIPLGYRAVWEKRGSLAIAKLGHKLTSTTTSSSYQSILIDSASKDGDFIEVNIFGPIHRRSIKQISGPEPRQKADKVLFNSIKKKIEEIGATFVIKK